MIFMILWFAAALAMIVAEYFLATKLRSPRWGGILPLLSVAAAVVVFAVLKQPMNFETLMPFAIVIVLLFGEWNSGRQAYRELQKARQQEQDG